MPGTDADVLESQSPHEVRLIEQLFTCTQNPEDDLAFFQERWVAGTCKWKIDSLSLYHQSLAGSSLLLSILLLQIWGSY